MATETRSAQGEQCVGRGLRNHTDVVDADDGARRVVSQRNENEFIRSCRKRPIVGVGLPCSAITNEGKTLIGRVAENGIVAPSFPFKAGGIVEVTNRTSRRAGNDF